jgi:hypothetical protein
MASADTAGGNRAKQSQFPGRTGTGKGAEALSPSGIDARNKANSARSDNNGKYFAEKYL